MNIVLIITNCADPGDMHVVDLYVDLPTPENDRVISPFHKGFILAKFH